MRKSGHSNILLLELLVVIFFFMISVTTIVELFAAARLKSLHAEAVNQAALQTENITEVLYARDDTEAELANLGFRQENETWIMETEQYVLQAVISEEAVEAGQIRTVTLTALKGEDKLLKIPATRYIPGEVEP